MAKKADAEMITIMRKVLQEVDPETGMTYKELVVREVIQTAAGKKGSTKETVSAAINVIEKLAQTADDDAKKFFEVAKERLSINTYKVDTHGKQ